MRRKGNCADNAVLENFFGLLKRELYLPDFQTMAHFKAGLIDHLDDYNICRKKQNPRACRLLFTDFLMRCSSSAIAKAPSRPALPRAGSAGLVV